MIFFTSQERQLERGRLGSGDSARRLALPAQRIGRQVQRAATQARVGTQGLAERRSAQVANLVAVEVKVPVAGRPRARNRNQESCVSACGGVKTEAKA